MTFDLRPLAPATFLGIQDGFGIYPSIALYILREQVGIHPAGSTVSRQTLERHGFAVNEKDEAEVGGLGDGSGSMAPAF